MVQFRSNQWGLRVLKKVEVFLESFFWSVFSTTNGSLSPSMSRVK
jgi:hypothetical protein